MKKILPYVLLYFILLVSCTAKKTDSNSKKVFHEQIISGFDQQHHVGFILKDLQTGEVVFEKDADKSFNSSSNIRLFTLYTALNVLEDSIPTFQYSLKGDSLLLWPMADPTFLHPDFPSQPAFDFLKNSGKNIYLVNGRYKGNKFGNGWGWDNYTSGNQTEIRDLPIYGNVISYVVDGNKTATLSPDLPSLFYSELKEDSNTKTVRRSVSGNNLYVPASLSAGYTQKIPIAFNNTLTESLLTDTLLANGYAITSVIGIPWQPVSENAKIVYNNSALSLYKRMLITETNLEAEHLLLNCAALSGGEMSFLAGKRLANKYLSGVLEEKSYRWEDACGLSPNNLASPRVFATLLEKIDAKIADREKLLSLFPAHLANNQQAFAFAQEAKTTTVYNVTGYLIGKSGKTYAFSYLNNNIVKPESEIKSEIEKNLLLIHSNF